MTIAALNTLINATPQNLSQFKGLTAAYNVLLGGVPSIDGYTFLINNNNTTNFGSGPTGPTFNDENIYINTVNALYQGNPAAKTAFDAILTGATTVQQQLTAIYNFIIPEAQRTPEGLAYIQGQAAFFTARAAELGIVGANGAAVVAFGSLMKIAVDSPTIVGLGDSIRDLIAAVGDGSAQIPQGGTAFTPVETADGTKFDGNDAGTGTTFTLTVNNDTYVGTKGNDTVTGLSTTFQATDVIIDQTSTDNDTLDLTLTAAPAAAAVSGIENINVTINSTATAQFSAATYSGVKNLTVTRGDVVVGGSTIQGNKTVDVTNVDSTKIAKITAGAGTTTVDVNQTAATAADSKAGVTVDANTATGNVTVTGAATVQANNSITTVAVNALVGAAAAENAKAVSIEAAKAATVTTGNNLKGAITINAAAATTVTVNDAAGGATIDAVKGGQTGITVSGIDDSGATIKTGSYLATAAGTVTLGGTAGTTDKAAVSAAGSVNLTSNNGGAQIENLDLSGNGAAVIYTLTGSATTTTLSGAQDVTLRGASTVFDGKTVTDASTDKTTSVNLTTVASADLSKVASDQIVLAATGANAALDLASGAKIVLAKDQTGLTLRGKAADATVNVVVADDTNADGTEIELTLGALNLATNVKVANIDATVGKFTATGTTATDGTNGTTINVTGSKDVALGTVVAKEVNASALTGKLNVTSAVTAVITGGAGADTITLNDTNSTTTKFTVDAGAGNNTINVTHAKEASLIAAGSGEDTVTVSTAAAVVVSTGGGNDTVNVANNVDSDAILVGGDGTGDKLVLQDTNGNDFSDNVNFAFAGFEQVDISALTSGTIQISGAQLNGQTFTLKGNAVGDSLTIVGKSGVDNVINASTITVDTASVVITGAAKNDTLTGTSSADTFNATAGSDIINGGAGSDTYSFAGVTLGGALEGTGTGTQTGVVVNLGATAIANTTIVSANAGFTANTVTSVESGKVAYLYAAAAATNSAVQQTLSSIENVTGTSGKDYIVGSAGANSIDGGAEADYIIAGKGADTITGGTGADTLVQGADDSVVATATSFAAATIANGDTITFGNGVDVVNGFATTSDKIDISITVPGATTNLIGSNNTNLADNGVFVGRGNYDAATKVFTFDGATGADTLVMYGGAAGSANDAVATNATSMVLVGVTTVAIGDFI